jgi:hypothetical protein
MKSLKRFIKLIKIFFYRKRALNKSCLITKKNNQLLIASRLAMEIATLPMEASKKYADINWRHWSKEFKSIYSSPKKLLRFSQNPVIIKTMTGETTFDNSDKVLPLISSIFANLVEEDLVGNQIIINDNNLTSASRLGHLFVATKIHDSLLEINYSPKKICEIGGGFGGLMSIFLRAYEEFDFKMYDLPTFLPLQYFYINSVLESTKKNALHGISHFQSIDDIDENSAKGSLLISNWALTESNENLQNFAMNSNLFGADVAVICCEGVNLNHPATQHMHKYLGCKASKVFNLDVCMKNSSMFLIDFRQ